jgi:alpha-tubulin suppressor-like RCC1 family protein
MSGVTTLVRILCLLGGSAVVACSGAAAASPGSELRAAATPTAKAIAAGGIHTCALTSAGAVQCWGDNRSGQLGDGTSAERHSPVTVSGLGSGVAAIATGGIHSCGLTSAGGVKCWGDNRSGQLGDGTTSARHTPVGVSGLSSGVTAIAAGGFHTCALTSAGGVKCWGDNRSGQLGDGTMTEHTTPVPVSGLSSGVVAISAGDYHTCALTTAHAVKCWGYNFLGQLGNGTIADSSVPVAVSGLAGGVAAIAAGGLHSCALTSAGAVRCWGDNRSGQLGDGTTTERHTPVAVSGLASGVAAIAAGGDHSCARMNTSVVECWGENGSGQLGDGTTTERHTPVVVSGLASDVAAISAGGFHTCALTSAGAVRCWGDNPYGQLGDGTKTSRRKPVRVIRFGASPPRVRCVVPYVRGKLLAKAKRRIVHAHCRLGKVKRVASHKKKNTVVGESPRAGKRLKKGAKVNLRVSRGRR